jgi:HD-like signal output (HDOD) protein
MADEISINQQICRLKNLPELPEASIKIIKAVSNPNIEIEELAAIIAISPVLTARLLGLANSAYFGRSGQIKDLKTAIIRVLGLNLVKSLTIGVVLNLALDTSRCRNFKSEKLWMHALVTAILGHKLSHLIRDEVLIPATSYTAGILLNIGLIAAVHLFPEATDQALLKSEQNTTSVAVELSNIIGHTQYEIGALLLEHWQLPGIYQTVLKEFNNVNYFGAETKFIIFLSTCHGLAKKILADKEMDLIPDIEKLEVFGTSLNEIQAIINEISSDKENIFAAALAISGK